MSAATAASMRNAVITEKEEVVSLMPDATSISSVRDRRWWILGVVGLAQLMVVLDATIVNIALPSAQRDLGFSNADRQWVVTAYSLAFGGLLLKGGSRTAGGLADAFALSKPTMSGHFAKVKEAGLIEADQQGATIRYSLNLSVLEEVLLGFMGKMGTGKEAGE